MEPKSRRPHGNSRAVNAELRERILTLRRELQRSGLDHGPISIAARLDHEGIRPPATSTIRRILTAAGLISPEPKKRPKSSYRRFEADQPNECWQSDFTHWQLADGTGVEIISWLDDHSRYLLASLACRRVTGPIVISTFLTTAGVHGLPQSTLTDNGSVYTSRFTGGRNGFEYLLADLGITQKNGHPGHPQTQGKIERFQQTLKRWLAAQPAAATIAELQTQLDTFTGIYNQIRPHRALHGATPANAYAATIKAAPAAQRRNPHYRVRNDHVVRLGDQPPPRRPHASPRRRRRPHRSSGDNPHRPRHRHRDPPRHRRSPQHPHHRPRPQLLAQPTQTTRPMATANMNDDPTQI